MQICAQPVVNFALKEKNERIGIIIKSKRSIGADISQQASLYYVIIIVVIDSAEYGFISKCLHGNDRRCVAFKVLLLLFQICIAIPVGKRTNEIVCFSSSSTSSSFASRSFLCALIVLDKRSEKRLKTRLVVALLLSCFPPSDPCNQIM